jgi:ribosomal protein L44E
LATLEGFDEWEPVAVDVAERPDEKAPHMVAMSWQHRVDNRILAVVHSTPAPLPSDKHKLTSKLDISINGDSPCNGRVFAIFMPCFLCKTSPYY